MTSSRSLLTVGVGLACALSGAAQAPGGPSLGDWVVKDVVRPMEVPGENFRWDLALPLGDFDSDGMVDLMLSGDSYSRSGIGWAPGWSERWKDVDVPAVSTLQFSAGVRPLSTLLHRPAGPTLLAEDSRTTPHFQHGFFDVATGQLLGIVPYPTPPSPGLPPIGFLGSVQRAGDVNADGFEDAFFQASTGSYCVTGVVDGQTMTVAWQHYLPNGTSAYWTYCRTDKGWPDIDGDGGPDLIYSTLRYYPPSSYARTMEAVSGATGTVLWSRTYPEGDASGAVVEDLTGDGIGEVLFSSPGYGALQCLDGASGAELWSAPIANAASLLPNLQYLTYKSAMGVGRSPITGALEVTIATHCITPTGGVVEESGFLHLDALTGAPLRYRTIDVPDLHPWLPDAVDWEVNGAQLVGDIDRDGVVEVTNRTWTPSLSNPPVIGEAAAMVVWSPCTLEVAASAPLGSTVDFKTRIPSSPGRQALLVLSRGFDAEQGVVHGEWPLHLVDDGLFRLTSGLASGPPPLWVTLDATGYAETSVSVPANPAFLGSVVYSKVVVPELAQPKGIYTASTLGVTVITP